MSKNGDEGVNRIVNDVKEKGKTFFNEGWGSARQVLEDNADILKKKAGEFGDMTVEEIADDVKYHVRRHPLASIGIAFGVGVVIGSFLSSD